MRFYDITFVLRFVLHEPVFEACFGLLGSPLHDCPIGLFDLLMTLEHLVQTSQCFARSGEEHYPARRAIQTVRDTQEHLTGLVVFDLDIRLDGFAQRRVSGLIALHDLVAGLIDGDNMIVLVQYGHKPLCLTAS